MFAQPGRACSFCGRDLWDVAHYVSAGPVAICDLCIEAAQDAVASASPSDGRELFLPPRIFGDAGTPQDAEAIAEAFRAVFSGSSTAESRGPYIDGEDEVRGLLTEAHQRVPGHAASARVERIRFLDADTAEVRFQVIGPIFEGRSVRKNARWLVTSDTIVRVTAMAGVVLPGGRGRRS
jgi:hypothetical protein